MSRIFRLLSTLCLLKGFTDAAFPDCILEYPGQALQGANQYRQVPVGGIRDQCVQACVQDWPKCQGVLFRSYSDGSHTCTMYEQNSRSAGCGCNIYTPPQNSGEAYHLWEIPQGCSPPQSLLAPQPLFPLSVAGSNLPLPSPVVAPVSVFQNPVFSNVPVFPESVPNIPYFPSQVLPYYARNNPTQLINWGPWGPCSASCGSGTRYRHADCFNCPGPYPDAEACNLGPCASWTQWNQWSPCSVTCGNGVQQRIKMCSHGYGQCPGQTPSESKSCTQSSCAHWSPWTQWEACSVTCGRGQQSRKRTCIGDRCEGPREETTECSGLPCPTFGPWTQWGPCSKSCDQGIRQRGRTCTSIGTCQGPPSETGLCNVRPCPDWSPWSHWTDCTTTCGGGLRRRHRSCAFGYGCLGAPVETIRCSFNQCPVWSEWNPWSSCSASCGNGVKSRDRVCSGGGFCPGGNGQQSEGCNAGPCATWNSWAPWNSCSVSCGKGGERQRVRSCSRGAYCPGSNTEQGACDMPDCPVEVYFKPSAPVATVPFNPLIVPLNAPPVSYSCQYDAWGEWSQCSRTCGTGYESRKRACPCGSCDHLGTAVETRPCSNRPGLIMPPCPGFFNPRFRPFYLERNFGGKKKSKKTK